jgi:AhpD family alkylhydroperoxidase
MKLAPVAAPTTATASRLTADDPACCCAEPDAASAPVASIVQSAPAKLSNNPVHSDGELPAPADADALRTYMAAVSAPGALDTRHKKLIALALSVLSKCEPCITINVRAARQAGASEQEIAEAVAQGISFGGAPVAMFYNQLRSRTTR